MAGFDGLVRPWFMKGDENMIVLHINPARVERIEFISNSDVEEDFDFAAWQTIRPLVDQIDVRLAEVVALVLSEEKA